MWHLFLRAILLLTVCATTLHDSQNHSLSANPATNPTPAQPPETGKDSWEQLGRRQREFKELVRVRFVLSDEGLLAVQRQKLQTLRLQLEWQMHLQTEAPRATINNEILERLTQSLFETRAAASFSATFDYRIDGGGFSLKSAYEAVRERSSGTYESVLTRLEDEIDEASFRFHWPFLSDYLPLPGLSLEKLERYRALFDPEQTLSIDLWMKLATGQELNFSEFESYLKLPHLKKSASPLAGGAKHLYALYRVFGLLCFESQPVSRADLMNQLSQVEKELQEPLNSITEADLRLALLIHETRRRTPSWAWTEILTSFEWQPDEVPSLEYVGAKYRMSSEDLDPSVVATALDRVAESHIAGAGIRTYYEASEQIQSGLWAYLPAEDFSFFQLAEEDQNILMARLFPELTLKEARYILDLRFFELSEMDRLALAQKIFRDPSALEDFFRVYFAIRETPEDIMRAFHATLTRALLDPLNEDPGQPETLRLLNGRSIARVAAKRAELFEEQTKTRIGRNATSTLSRLQDWIQLQLNPYPEFWSDEYSRFIDLWERLEKKESQLSELQSLIQRYHATSDRDLRLKLSAEIQELTLHINLLIQPDSLDPDSFGILAAAFAHGALPQTAADYGVSLLAVGAGGGFALVTSLLGKRVMIWFLIGDTGLAYMTAKFLSETHELDLTRSFSSPLGYGALLFWNDLTTQLGTVFSAAPVHKRVTAAERLGGISREMVLAGAGYRWASRTQTLSILSRARTARSLDLRIKRLEQERSKLVAKESELEVTIKRLQDERAEALRTLAPDHQAHVEIERGLQAKLSELQRVRGDQVAVSEGRIFFYLKQSLTLGVDVLRLSNPLRREPVPLFGTLKKRFSFSERRGLLQVNAEMRKLEVASRVTLSELSFQERRPHFESLNPRRWIQVWSQRRRLNNLKKAWSKTQDEMGSRWSEMRALMSEESLSPGSARTLSVHVERGLTTALQFARTHYRHPAWEAPRGSWPMLTEWLSKSVRRLRPEDLPARPEWEARALFRRQVDDLSAALQLAEAHGKAPKSLRAARQHLKELNEILNP